MRAMRLYKMMRAQADRGIVRHQALTICCMSPIGPWFLRGILFLRIPDASIVWGHTGRP